MTACFYNFIQSKSFSPFRSAASSVERFVVVFTPKGVLVNAATLDKVAIRKDN